MSENEFVVLEIDALDALEHQIWLCGECLFFKLDDDEILDGEYPGYCRRHAPAFDREYSGWPYKTSGDWCGDSKPNKAVMAAMRAEAEKDEPYLLGSVGPDRLVDPTRSTEARHPEAVRGSPEGLPGSALSGPDGPV